MPFSREFRLIDICKLRGNVDGLTCSHSPSFSGSVKHSSAAEVGAHRAKWWQTVRGQQRTPCPEHWRVLLFFLPLCPTILKPHLEQVSIAETANENTWSERQTAIDRLVIDTESSIDFRYRLRPLDSSSVIFIKQSKFPSFPIELSYDGVKSLETRN